ncbi:ribosomal protein S5 domain 2-type protein, partial [Paraphysoderma sedebokerense]
STAVSAPGKVLVTGGYLVLDREYSGIVIATSSRFYCIIQTSQETPSVKSAATLSDITFKIRLTSPQFLDPPREYEVKINSKGIVNLCTSYTNPYIDHTLKFCLSLITGQYAQFSDFSRLVENGIIITIVGDNDFYSQRKEISKRSLPLTSHSLASLPPFAPTHGSLKSVHKTGLGSSAALVTSLVSALFSFFGVVDIPTEHVSASEQPQKLEEDKTLIHNMAQFCHCFAQGKIGSGFDVSSAVWGTHVYQRFSPKVLEPLLANVAISPNISPTRWDNEIRPFHLAPGLSLVLADIDAGSNTPSMVSQVLNWKKTRPEEARPIWSVLNDCNQRIAKLFDTLWTLWKQSGDSDSEKGTQLSLYWSTLGLCSELPASGWGTITDTEVNGELVNVLKQIYETSLVLRRTFRLLSSKAQVPIEPPCQTELLDACLNCPGVVMCGVPGAGGFDAIFVVYLSPAKQLSLNITAKHSDKPGGRTPRQHLEDLWQNYNGLSVCPLLAECSHGGLSKVSDTEMERLRHIL